MRRGIIAQVVGTRAQGYALAMTATSVDPSDPFVKRLLRHTTGLRLRAQSDDERVVVVYCGTSGHRPFAIGREGLLIDPDGEARFIPFTDIEHSGYYGAETLMREKATLEAGGILQEPLSITLHGGEMICLPLDPRADNMSERLAIGGLVEQRVRMARSAKARG